MQFALVLEISTLLPFLPCVHMCCRGRVFGLSVSLFVCPLLLGLDVFKGSLYTKQVVKVKKIACRWSMIDRNGLEAKKNACFDRRLNVAFKCDNHFSIRKLHLTQLQCVLTLW